MRCVCNTLRKASRALSRVYDEALRPCDLLITQYALLKALRRPEPLTVNQLADELVLDRTTLTRNLQPLEKQRLLTIEPGRDQRQRLVRLTSEGERKFQEAHPYWERAQERIQQSISAPELERVLGDLERLREWVRSEW